MKLVYCLLRRTQHKLN